MGGLNRKSSLLSTAAILLLLILAPATVVLFRAQAIFRHQVRILEESSERQRSRIGQLDRAILDLERELSTRAPASLNDELSRSLDDLIERVGFGAHYLEEITVHTESILAALERQKQLTIESSSHPDDTDRASEIARRTEMERRRASRLQELRLLNRNLRNQWIGNLAERLSLTEAQTEGIAALYDQQSEQWDGLYQQAREGGLNPGSILEEMNRIRTETDASLLEILGPDLKMKFRSGERDIFPDVDPRQEPMFR